jgi:hypothetical protein
VKLDFRSVDACEDIVKTCKALTCILVVSDREGK